jgi:VWFA-related protein
MRGIPRLVRATAVVAASLLGVPAPRVAEAARTLPVWVSGADGKPVSGLTAADFSLKEDGQPVPVAAAAPAGATRRRRILFLFDLASLGGSQLPDVRHAAADFAREKMAPGDLGAVASYSTTGGLTILLNFTADRGQVAAAVSSVGRTAPAGRISDPLQVIYSLDEASPGADLSAAAPRGDSAARQERLARFLQSFARLARALDAVGGRKQILYFSSGFDMKLLQGKQRTRELFKKISEQTSESTGELVEEVGSEAGSSLDSQLPEGSGLDAAWKALLDLFRRSDAAVDAVDMASGGKGAEGAAMKQLAEETGGRRFEGLSNFRKLGAGSLDPAGAAYVLDFDPAGQSRPGTFHPVEIAVKREGAAVSARPGYYDSKPASEQSALERNFEAAEMLAAGSPSPAMRMDVLAAAFAGKGRALVPVLVHVDPAVLLAAASVGPLPVEINGYAYDAENRIGDFFSQNVTVDMSQARPQIQRGGLLYYAPLSLPAGSYRVRVLVREGDGVSAGVGETSLAVPDFATAAPALLPPIFLGGTPDGLVVHGLSARTSSGPPPDYPYLVGGQVVFPQVPAIVSAGGEAKLCVFAYHLGGPGAPVQLGARVLPEDGRPAMPAQLALTGRSNPDESGLATYTMSLQAGGLFPGRYTLRVVMQDPSTGAARQAATPFEVR